MSILLENINVSRSFTGALDVPIIQATSLSLDTLEFVWGLHRGQLMSYFELVPGNVLRLQPELKKAIELEQVALCPPNAIVKSLAALQERNMKLPLSKRRMFTEVCPFKAYEYRIVPVDESVSLFTRDPTTGAVSKLKGISTFTCSANPAFVLTYASDALLDMPTPVAHKLAVTLRNAVDACFRPWQTACPSLEFYEGSYLGEFGRSVPVRYRGVLPRCPPESIVVDEEEDDEQDVINSDEDEEERVQRLQAHIKRRKVQEEDVDLVDSLEAALLRMMMS